MKKSHVVISFFLLNILIFAQSPINKGVYTINGNISFSSLSSDQMSSSQNVFIFNPQIGYFFIDNLYSALSLNYMHRSYSSTFQDYYGIGPALRYYFDAEKIKPFLGLGLIYNKQTDNHSMDISYTEWKISGGIDYFVTNNFALEGSLNYSFINYKNQRDQYKLFQLGIGVNYFIF